MAYRGRRILSVVPARGGSKGIPRKNLIKVNGKSLIAHAASICSELTWIDRAIISTNDDEMKKEGLEYGLQAPFQRPLELSKDSASALSVWKHAIQTVEQIYSEIFDISILLEPTSPCRKCEDVQRAVDVLINDGHQSLVTVSQTDPKNHPLKQLTIKDKNLLHYQAGGELVVNRQELETVYHRNGIAYVASRDYLFHANSIIGDETGVLVIDRHVANIDEQIDLEFAEFLLTRAGASSEGL